MTTRRVRLHYDPAELDRKWQQRWEESGIYRVRDDDPRPKWYELTMYPYSSGDLHIGHWYPMGPSDKLPRPFPAHAGVQRTSPHGL